MTTLNNAGVTYAHSLIDAGKVDKDSDWSFTAADGKALLGDGNDWANYGRNHMGVDASAADNTEAHFKYPFAKGGKLYRSALTAIRDRAAQQGDSAIFNAAGRLIDEIDGKNADVARAAPVAAAEIERRGFVADIMRIERRSGKGALLIGHAAVFNALSSDLGGFREQIAPGAFADAIKTDDVRALFNHDPNFVLGRNKSGTLDLAEDARGLAIKIDMPDTKTVRDLVVAPIERGDISQMSFQFSAIDQAWDGGENNNAPVVRTLKKVRLFDVAPVTFPAYPQTDVAVRQLRGFLSARQDVPRGIPNLVRAKDMLARVS
jgi:HK97 family phage prohead protease